MCEESAIFGGRPRTMGSGNELSRERDLLCLCREKGPTRFTPSARLRGAERRNGMDDKEEGMTRRTGRRKGGGKTQTPHPRCEADNRTSIIASLSYGECRERQKGEFQHVCRPFFSCLFTCFHLFCPVRRCTVITCTRFASEAANYPQLRLHLSNRFRFDQI